MSLTDNLTDNLIDKLNRKTSADRQLSLDEIDPAKSPDVFQAFKEDKARGFPETRKFLENSLSDPNLVIQPPVIHFFWQITAKGLPKDLVARVAVHQALLHGDKTITEIEGSEMIRIAKENEATGSSENRGALLQAVAAVQGIRIEHPKLNSLVAQMRQPAQAASRGTALATARNGSQAASRGTALATARNGSQAAPPAPLAFTDRTRLSGPLTFSEGSTTQAIVEIAGECSSERRPCRAVFSATSMTGGVTMIGTGAIDRGGTPFSFDIGVILTPGRYGITVDAGNGVQGITKNLGIVTVSPSQKADAASGEPNARGEFYHTDPPRVVRAQSLAYQMATIEGEAKDAAEKAFNLNTKEGDRIKAVKIAIRNLTEAKALIVELEKLFIRQESMKEETAALKRQRRDFVDGYHLTAKALLDAGQYGQVVSFLEPVINEDNPPPDWIGEKDLKELLSLKKQAGQKNRAAVVSLMSDPEESGRERTPRLEERPPPAKTNDLSGGEREKASRLLRITSLMVGNDNRMAVGTSSVLHYKTNFLQLAGRIGEKAQIDGSLTGQPDFWGEISGAGITGGVQVKPERKRPLTDAFAKAVSKLPAGTYTFRLWANFGEGTQSQLRDIQFTIVEGEGRPQPAKQRPAKKPAGYIRGEQ